MKDEKCVSPTLEVIAFISIVVNFGHALAWIIPAFATQDPVYIYNLIATVSAGVSAIIFLKENKKGFIAFLFAGILNVCLKIAGVGIAEAVSSANVAMLIIFLLIFFLLKRGGKTAYQKLFSNDK